MGRGFIDLTKVFRESQKEHRIDRRLERRLPVRGLERCPGCHPEPIRFAQGKLREGSLHPASQTLRCAQGDRHSLQISAKRGTDTRSRGTSCSLTSCRGGGSIELPGNASS